jgi:hypothetical protein
LLLTVVSSPAPAIEQQASIADTTAGAAAMTADLTPPAMDAMIAGLRARAEPLPRPRPQVSRQDISAAEALFGRPLPADFVAFQLGAGDVAFGTIEPVTLQPDSGHTQFATVLADARAWGLPDDLLPICKDNSDFYLMAADGSVHFWSHDDGGLTGETWPSLAAWIDDVWLGSDL